MEDEDMQERRMTFTVEKVLATMEKNAETHKKDYENLVKKNHEHVMAETRKALADLEEGRMPSFAGLNKAIAAKPTDHSDDYRRFISMLKSTTQGSIDLSEYEFDRYMNDNWDWKREVVSNMTMYGLH